MGSYESLEKVQSGKITVWLRNKTDATANGRKVNCCAMKILLAPQSREAFLFHLVLFYFCKVAFLLIYGICGMQAMACHLLSNTGPSHSAHCCLVFVLVLFLVKMHYMIISKISDTFPNYANFQKFHKYCSCYCVQ